MAIVFGTSEKFVPKGELGSALFKIGWPRLGVSLPILLLILFMAFVQQFDTWFLPLLVQDVHGSLKGVSVWTGSLGAVGGVAGFLAGVILGRLADRMSPPRVAKFSAVGAAVMMIPQGLAHTFLVLFPARFCMTFCAAGLDPVFQIWLAKVTPEDRRGFIFGWVGTAKALGWMAAPLASGLVASGFGVRAIYFVECLLFLLLIPCTGMVVRAIAGNGATRRAGA
jgi:MFS family permease